MINKSIFKNEKDLIISAYHHIPDKPSHKGILLCHGMRSNKKGTKVTYLANKFCKIGYHALRFDFRYVGESEGKYEDLTLTGEIQDLAGAFLYFQRKGVHDISIVGSSLGATVASVFASTQPQLSRLVTISAPFLFKQEINNWFPEKKYKEYKKNGIIEYEGQKIKWDFVEDLLKYDFESIIPEINCPVLIFHGTADKIVNPNNSDFFYRNLHSEKKFLSIIKNGDHRLNEHLDFIWEEILEFFEKTK